MYFASLISDPIVGQNCAFFTFDMLSNTLSGVTFPTTVTFFAAKSMLNELTPAHIYIQINYINLDRLIFKICNVNDRLIFKC